MAGLAPLIEVISGQDSEDELNYKDFRRWAPWRHVGDFPGVLQFVLEN